MKLEPANSSKIAYFTMEVGLDPDMPTYSGGLGVLAGDILNAAADLSMPLVGITLLHRKGYFHQKLDKAGNQLEKPVRWYPEKFLEPLTPRVSLTLEGRTVWIKAWRYLVHGVNGHHVNVYFLDTALEENSAYDQTLTDFLYGGDDRYRLCQEALLGMGGLSMLRALGHKDVTAYHMNEGHSALLALALLEEGKKGKSLATVDEKEIERVRNRCIFTTHTPVPAGHDKFPIQQVEEILGKDRAQFLKTYKSGQNGTMNTTLLALFFSRYINGVSSRHEEISQDMFPNYPINSITNGVHSFTWTADPFRRLYDNHIPEWRYDNLYLRYARGIPLEEIAQAHTEAKRALFQEIKDRTGKTLDLKAITLGFARRSTAYKRSTLLLSDPERLVRMARDVGPLQIVYAGKAHPRDDKGKAMIRRVYEIAKKLKGQVSIYYLENYDMNLGKLLTSGVDLWVNTPEKPREASGTSGMKAAMNGVPSLSVLDGWWIDGHVEGVTGWSVGESDEPQSDNRIEARSLYRKLEKVIVPMFYKKPEVFAKVMRSAIALNGSFFNAQRMMFQYYQNAYVGKNGD